MKDINFHKILNINTDKGLNNIAGNTNIWFQSDGRIFIANLDGTPREMAPKAETGRYGMVRTSDVYNGSITDPSIVPNMKALKIVYEEIMSPDKDVKFGGNISIGQNTTVPENVRHTKTFTVAKDGGVIFPTTSEKNAYDGSNVGSKIIGTQYGAEKALAIFAEDNLIVKPSRTSSEPVTPDMDAMKLDMNKGDLYITGSIYAAEYTGDDSETAPTFKKVITLSPQGGFNIKPEDIGAAAANHTHRFSQITNVPTATEVQKGIVQLSSSTTSSVKTMAATPAAVNSLRGQVDKKFDKTGGKLTGTIDFDIAGDNKTLINANNDDRMIYNDALGPEGYGQWLFGSDNSSTKASVKAGYMEVVNYLVVNNRKVHVRTSEPSDAKEGDVWIQV